MAGAHTLLRTSSRKTDFDTLTLVRKTYHHNLGPVLKLIMHLRPSKKTPDRLHDTKIGGALRARPRVMRVTSAYKTITEQLTGNNLVTNHKSSCKVSIAF
jgi:hypothetical protein